MGGKSGSEKGLRGEILDTESCAGDSSPRKKTERGEEQRKEGTVRRGAGTGLALAGGTEVSDVCVCV